jgi:hypothetical protein
MGDDMATKETMTLSGDRVPCLNVTLPVGPGKMNAPDDVLLVQGLLNYIAEGFRSTEPLGLPSRRDLPRLTGVADRKTFDAIRRFQTRWGRILLAADGVIHPAHYYGRNVELDGTTRRMAITHLHQLAQESAARMNETGYTEDLVFLFPELTPFVRRM